MRIAYGIHGFGRGHAMRANSVLPHLADRHELLIMAGGDAYRALQDDYRVMRIPMLGYHYNKETGRFSNYLNLKHNLPMVLDMFWNGPTSQMIAEAIEEFEPDVVITDSEGFTHRVAERMGIPRITFDHFGVLVYCKLQMSGLDRLICAGNSFVYKTLYGEPERIVVSAFFDAPALREGVRVVGPAIRREVRETVPTRGEHLLVYINKGEHEYTPQIERALKSLSCPVVVYGVPRQGKDGNLQYKPIANLPFIQDVASSRAVFCTAGNQLCGEITYFGKPVLGMPMACLEQRINSRQLVTRGVGMEVKRDEVTANVLHEFLEREPEFAARAARYKARDGAQEALCALEEFMAELVEGKSGKGVWAGEVVPQDDTAAAGSPRIQDRDGQDPG